MNPGRILGVIMGLIILLAIFAFPISSTQSTLYNAVEPLLEVIGDIQYLPTQEMIFSYILIIAFILLIIAGLVGFFPLATGVLGIVGMAMLSVAPFFVNLSVEWASGFYTLWIASIAALGASFWHWRTQPKEQVVQVNVQPQTYPITPPPPQHAPQVPTPQSQPSTIIVSPTIKVKTEDKTETAMPTPQVPRPIEAKTEEETTPTSSALEPEMGLTTGAIYTPEEVMKMFLMLKERVGSLSLEKAKASMSKFRFKDISGRNWTIDLQTNRWVFYDGKKWVEATPPPILESA